MTLDQENMSQNDTKIGFIKEKTDTLGLKLEASAL